ncbi:hypothetical protein J1N35_044083 [Gossypium stocksii]|uniref:Uncharacterized protein n=1 Tax=Gossypium stocksii TaxID=47602 RepID=A0A9D3ZFJ0_9ROSI|nr:hypothetical protein J1N35_044083 [Gossypium stocksii]
MSWFLATYVDHMCTRLAHAHPHAWTPPRLPHVHWPKQQAMDVPKPEKFKGAIKANTASIYFTDVALLWWCRRSMDEKHGGNTIRTWEEF